MSIKKYKVLGIIPARYYSTRFPGKLLALLNGKPIIQHVYERTKEARLIDKLIVATDNNRILKVVRNFGGKCIISSEKFENGTQRVIKAAELLGNRRFNIVLNIQGDEPLLHPSMINDLIKVMKSNKEIKVASLCTSVKTQQELNDKNVVKIILDKDNYALSFFRLSVRDIDFRKIYKHIGIYIYRRDFLMRYTSLEEGEFPDPSLEQLKILNNGYKIRMVKTEYDTISVDTPADLERIKNLREE